MGCVKPLHSCSKWTLAFVLDLGILLCILIFHAQRCPLSVPYTQYESTALFIISSKDLPYDCVKLHVCCIGFFSTVFLVHSSFFPLRGGSLWKQSAAIATESRRTNSDSVTSHTSEAADQWRKPRLGLASCKLPSLHFSFQLFIKSIKTPFKFPHFSLGCHVSSTELNTV